MSKSAKRKITVLICILIIIVSIILNVILLSTKVFRGSYTAQDSSGKKITITFYDNTYSMGNRMGFYYYQSLSDYTYSSTNKKLEKDCIILLGDTNMELDTYYLYKNSVFHLSYAGWGNSSINGMKFYCSVAIFLQVLYPILIIISIVLIVLIYMKKIFKEIDGVT